MIHPTAIIDTKAELDSTVQVGPYAVIDGGVRLGAHCTVGPHAYLTGQTTLGRNNQIHAGSVIGDAPQDLKYSGEPTRVHIGDHNVLREHFTVHRSNHPEGETVIGSHNFLMAHSHVGHNTVVGDHVIMANGALLAGHVVVQDRAVISGNCLVHQFVRVGELSLMQGGSAISKDLPPYTVARGDNGMCGLNVIGLRRAGLKPEERLELKKLYHALFRSRSKLKDALASARKIYTTEAACLVMEFVEHASRGIVSDTSLDAASSPES